jgi:hypothetical protein
VLIKRNYFDFQRARSYINPSPKVDLARDGCVMVVGMALAERKVRGGLHLTSYVLPYNAKAVQAACPRNGKRTVYKIDGVTGLRLHVLPTPRRSGSGIGPTWKARWYVHYKLRTGSRKSVQYAIGSRETMALEQAKARAREIITFVEDKKCDPRAAEQAARGYTFKQLFAHWLEGYAKPNLRAWQQPRDKLTKHAVPFIGDMQLSHIKPSHINQLLDRLVAVKKGTRTTYSVSEARDWSSAPGRKLPGSSTPC